MSKTTPILTQPTSIEKIAWYPCNEGTGEAIADKFGNETTDGAVKGTDKDVWIGGNYITITAGNNSGVHFLGDYTSQIYDLSTLSEQSLVLFWNYRKPAADITGIQYYYSLGTPASGSYGGVGFIPNIEGGTLDHDVQLYFGIPGGATNQVWDGQAMGDQLEADDKHKWRTMCTVFHSFDGWLYIDWYLHGIYGGSGRLFQIEDDRPTVSPSARLVFSGRPSSGNILNGLDVGSGLKDLIVFRTVGDERHNLPKWVKQMHYASLSGGIPEFLGA